MVGVCAVPSRLRTAPSRQRCGRRSHVAPKSRVGCLGRIAVKRVVKQPESRRPEAPAGPALRSRRRPVARRAGFG